MKNTKKSMFITTILMVAVLIVAVSTATFAWYTASNTGAANSAVLTSATASSANIAVGWSNNATTTEIAFNGSQTVSPMAPNAVIEPAEGQTTVKAISFSTANIDSTGKFGTVNAGTPWTVKNAQVGADADAPDYIAANSKSSFFVINHNVNAGATVTVTADISGNLADMLLIAVFINGDLAGILTNRSSYVVGPVSANNYYTDLDDASDHIKVATTGFTFDLDAKGATPTGNYAEITINAWLDGTALDSSYAGQSAAFDLDFNAAVKNS